MEREVHSAPVANAEPIGEINISRSYDVDKMVGEGGYGWVYLATRLSDKRHVALKRFKRADTCPEKLQEEFSIMKKISCEGIVQCYDLFYSLDQGVKVYYMSMQYLPGNDLFDLLRLNYNIGVREKDLLQIVTGVLKIVDYMHSHRVAHLDLKAENIRMCDGKFYIIDFGFACTDESTLGPRGTRNYASPEIFALACGYVKSLSFEAYQKADIWSVGVCFLELAAGRRFGELLEGYHQAVIPRSFYRDIERKDLTLPERVFDMALKNITSPFADILRSMLIINYKDRPTAHDVMKRIKHKFYLSRSELRPLTQSARPLDSLLVAEEKPAKLSWVDRFLRLFHISVNDKSVKSQID